MSNPSSFPLAAIRSFTDHSQGVLTFADANTLVRDYIHKEGMVTDLPLHDPHFMTDSHLGYMEKNRLEQLLVASAARGHIALTERLVQFGVDIHCIVEDVMDQGFFTTPLLKAVETENSDVVEFLLLHGAKMESGSPSTPFRFSGVLHAANSQDVIHLLCRFGCSNEALQQAITLGYPFQALLSEKMRERNALLLSCVEGRIKTVKALLDAQVYVDSYDNDGKNALYFATSFVHVAIVEILVQSGATICFSKNKETSLHWIIRSQWPTREHFSILQKLFAKELDVEIKEEDKGPSLQETAKVILAKMITTLLYKVKRKRGFDSDPCKKLRQFIQVLCETLQWSLPDTLESYKQWLDSSERVDFFGSFLSSDSDSDEEALLGLVDLRSSSFTTMSEEFSEKADTILSFEKRAYSTADEASESETVRKIFESKRQEAQEIVKTRHIQGFTKVFTDVTKYYFTKDGALFIRGKGIGDETARKKGVQQRNQLFSGYVEGRSPLIHRAGIPSSPKGGDTTPIYVATYRGYCYISPLWNQASRKAHRKANELLKPLYSMAVQFAASNTSDFASHFSRLRASDRRDYLQRVAFYSRYLKDKIRALQTTSAYRLQLGEGAPDKLFNHFTYDNLGELLQTVYTTNYAFYFKLLRNEFFKIRFFRIVPYMSPPHRIPTMLLYMPLD